MKTRTWATLLAASGWMMSCGASNPEVSVNIRTQGGVDIDNLARIHMVVRACEADQLAYNGDVPQDGPIDPFTAGIDPGQPFYVWLQGWSACPGPCIPERDAFTGDCLCFAGQTPPMQQITAEFCTEWVVHESGNRTINAILAPWAPDFCPPPANACDDLLP